MTLYPRVLTTALLAGLCCLPTLAQSDSDFDPFEDLDQDALNESIFYPRNGSYISGTYGNTYDYTIRSVDIGGTGPGASDELMFDVDDGDVATLALGRYLGQSRIEFEVGFRQTELLGIRVRDFPFQADGDLEYLSFMGNFYYDINTPLRNVDLYLGAGAGLALITGNIDFDPPITVFSGLGGSRTTDIYDNTTHHFAYQFMAGASARLLDNLTVFGGYRFRGYTEGNDDTSLLQFREHYTQGFELGLRVDF